MNQRTLRRNADAHISLIFHHVVIGGIQGWTLPQLHFLGGFRKSGLFSLQRCQETGCHNYGQLSFERFKLCLTLTASHTDIRALLRSPFKVPVGETNSGDWKLSDIFVTLLFSSLVTVSSFLNSSVMFSLILFKWLCCLSCFTTLTTSFNVEGACKDLQRHRCYAKGMTGASGRTTKYGKQG